MIIFRIFGSLARLTAMLAAGTFLLAAADNASAKDGVVEVPAALNPDKLSIFRVVSATGRPPRRTRAAGSGGSGIACLNASEKPGRRLWWRLLRKGAGRQP